MLDYYRFKEIHDLFMKGKTEEARHVLMEMQSRYVSLCDENTMLKMQVQEFEDILYLSRNLVFDGFCYWLITGNIKQGPFCQSCYNRDGVLVRLAAAHDGKWQCATCGATYEREPRYGVPAPGFGHAFGAALATAHGAGRAGMAGSAIGEGRAASLGAGEDMAAEAQALPGAQAVRTARTGKLLPFVK
ncbi:hypothetical protein RVX_R07800 [Nitratidesulfovibrio sp. HK-II]|uniref:hypothetical protein n=1 Tax=Nitratidesulfovibrio sp. HK-II TaxID=2009266 RepID=UPI000E2EDA6F|nr:hypothetical protein [Nitratidesulfovibrio sp. HK-II]GBO95057.1 hypothetical protein RVX_0100 [Nitratidesulfovibrio sp. HK-II]